MLVNNSSQGVLFAVRKVLENLKINFDVCKKELRVQLKFSNLGI